MCECGFEIVRKDAKDAVFYETEWMHKEIELLEIPFLLENKDEHRKKEKA